MPAAAADDIPIQPGAARDGEPLTCIAEQPEEEAVAKTRPKDRSKHRPAERERSAPDKHVTAMLAALPALVKKRAAQDEKKAKPVGENGAGDGAKSSRRGGDKRGKRPPHNGAPSSARNSLALNGEEAGDWSGGGGSGPPMARIDAVELRVVSSGSESTTPRRERRETDSSSVTSNTSDEAVGASLPVRVTAPDTTATYVVRRESLVTAATARQGEVDGGHWSSRTTEV